MNWQVFSVLQGFPMLHSTYVSQGCEALVPLHFQVKASLEVGMPLPVLTFVSLGKPQVTLFFTLDEP